MKLDYKLNDCVALVVHGSIINYSPSILNMICFLSDRYILTIYHVVPIKKVGVLERKNIKFQQIKFHDRNPTPIFLNGKINYRNIPILLNISELKIVLYRLRRNLAKKLYFKKLERIKFNFLIAFDPDMLLLSKVLFPFAKIFFYSLELYLPSDANASQEVIDFEYESVCGLFIQSEERGKLFKKEFGISDLAPMFYLPVCYRGESIKGKKNYIKSTYSLGEDKRIAIYIGTILPSFMKDLLLAFKDLKDWVLYLHTVQGEEITNILREIINKEQLDNIILSEKYYDDVEIIGEVLSSSDAGIAWYIPTDKNSTTAGFSSGKIANYLRFGLPVVANNYPSFLQAVEHSGVGVCINQPNEISFALVQILNNYQEFSQNAFKEYDQRYRFENYEASLALFLKTSSGRKLN